MRRRAVSVVVLVVGVLVSLAAGSGSAADGWVVRDLGPGAAILINDRGHITGTDEIGRGFIWANGRVRARWSLGSVQTARYSNELRDLNDGGEVVGSDWVREKTADGFYLTHAYLWRNGRVIDLTPGRDKASEAADINNQGEIVGSLFTRSQGWSGFRWRDGRLALLSPPAIPNPSAARIDVKAMAINEVGQIVGTVDIEDTSRVLVWSKATKPRVYRVNPDRGCTPVAINETGTILCSTRGRAYVFGGGRWIRIPGTVSGNAINDRGQVVGQRNLHHAYLWQDGTIIDLTPELKGSIGTALNSDGQVVVNATRKASAASPQVKAQEAYVWEVGQTTLLPPLQPGDSTRANAINEHGEIVGWSGDHAVLWTKTG